MICHWVAFVIEDFLIMDAFLKRKRNFHYKLDKGYRVYVIRHEKYFYYGITCNHKQREFEHYKSIYELVLTDKYLLPLSGTKTLRMHKVIATDVVKCRYTDRSKTPLQRIKDYTLNLDVIGVYKTKEEALYIEAMLIKFSKNNKNCLNVLGRSKNIINETV